MRKGIAGKERFRWLLLFATHRDLVQESPLAFVPPSRLHQVPVPFSQSGRSDLVHESPLALVLPFPLHQVHVPFSQSGCSDLVHESAPTLVPPSRLHQVPASFSKSGRFDLVHESALSLVLPSRLHQVPRLFPTRAPTPYTIEQKCVLKGKFFSGIIERHPRHTIRKENL